MIRPRSCRLLLSQPMHHLKRITERTLSAFLILGVIASCSKEEPTPAPVADNVLAIVDGEPVKTEVFQYWWKQKGSRVTDETSRLDLLETLIERAALAKAAVAAGIDKNPEVQIQIENLLIAGLKEKHGRTQQAELKISESEIEAFYKQHLDKRFTTPAKVRVAVLWFKTRGQAPLADRYRPRLVAIREQLVSAAAETIDDKSFGKIAIDNSEHRTSRFKGGDLGWIEVIPTTDSWMSVVLNLAKGLRLPGDLSDVSSSDEGLFLVRLMDRREESVRPLEDVRALIEQECLRDSKQRLAEEFTKTILGGSTVERFEERLLEMELSHPAQ